MSEAQRQLMREASTIQDESPAGISGAPHEDNIMLWEAVITGPNGTVWEGGIFSLTLQFPDEYPNRPPTVMFTSDMFHPNVYPDGKVCLNILEEDWSPIFKVWSILTSIQSLLDYPNTDSPANQMAALLFEHDKAEYDRRVRGVVEQSLAQPDD